MKINIILAALISASLIGCGGGGGGSDSPAPTNTTKPAPPRSTDACANDTVYSDRVIGSFRVVEVTTNKCNNLMAYSSNNADDELWTFNQPNRLGALKDGTTYHKTTYRYNPNTSEKIEIIDYVYIADNQGTRQIAIGATARYDTNKAEVTYQKSLCTELFDEECAQKIYTQGSDEYERYLNSFALDVFKSKLDVVLHVGRKE